MGTEIRHYNHAVYYENVGRFLVETYSTLGGHINWVQPRWEYMHYHSMIRGVDLNIVVEAPDGNFVSYYGM
ncbi:MAG: hypothetical protein V3R57_07195 [Candidatus Bathyarchaeia archaeon]